LSHLRINYRTYDKALPPQAIRLRMPGWSGNTQKMADGSEPQPWHCLPFTEAATYGLELLYQYETECHVLNDGGVIRFEWDNASEPGGGLTGGEFVTFFPKPESKFYLFNTSLDVVAPPGHVLCTQAHPRFFTDESGTVPIALTGHVQTEWWPKKLFVVFKSPPLGGRHVFRKGEPYVELRFVPQRVRYELTTMGPEEESRRRRLEQDVLLAAPRVASNEWRNPSGYAFNNHYKILASAFARGGEAGVRGAVDAALEDHPASLAMKAPIPDALALGMQCFRQRKFVDAKHVYVNVLRREPTNAEAVNRLGVIAACESMPLLALKLMGQAVSLDPASTAYRNDLGEMYRRVGKYAEAEASFRQSLQIDPNNLAAMSALGVTLAEQGRPQEGFNFCRRAIEIGPDQPGPRYRMGLIFAGQGKHSEARSYFESALSLDADYDDARRALGSLAEGGNGSPTPAKA
jgi:tetratricopeptide (TPR) repeat protein